MVRGAVALAALFVVASPGWRYRSARGITTWWELHRSDVATLRSLLAPGEWEDFKDLATEPQGGRADG